MDEASPEWWVLPVTPTGGPALPAPGSCQQHPLFLCHKWGGGGAVEGRGPGRDRSRGENTEGKEPEVAPHPPLWLPSGAVLQSDRCTPQGRVGASTCA